jgi:hypothetical protein
MILDEKYILSSSQQNIYFKPHNTEHNHCVWSQDTSDLKETVHYFILELVQTLDLLICLYPSPE